jgi:hypothetical protein
MKAVLNKSSSMILILLAVSGLAGGMDAVKPVLTDKPPQIDGVIDDDVWSRAPRVRGFKTWSPDYGKPMQDDTVVYMAYDRSNLYFAFECFDSQPGTIKSSVTSRDNIRPDDWIGINLDTFFDQQSLHVFYCNPIGIQGDSRFEGGNEDHTVDMVWYSKGQINQKGYTVEVRIPFQSIRFSGSREVRMGVIFERKINRLSEIGTYPPLDAQQGPNFLTQTMPLLYTGVDPGPLVEVIPAATYSRRHAYEQNRLAPLGDETNISLTGKYGITSDLILDGTVNPDFSQVEADAGQVDFNLRYALFFPEKRPFFLEGLEKFNFAAAHSGDPLVEVVHTRNIVNPLAGFKLNGKAGKKDTLAAIYALDDTPGETDNPYSHFAIFRYKRSLAQDGFLGGFYTGRERTEGSNRLLGLDGQLRLNPSSQAGVHLFYTRTQEKTQKADQGHALGLNYAYNTRDWFVVLGLQDIGEDFKTETGYLTRTGLTRFRSGAIRMLYPKSKIIQRIDPIVHSIHLLDKFSALYETSNSLDIRLIMQRNSYLMFGGRYSTEIFQDQRLNTSGMRFLAQSQLSKRFSINASYQFRNKIRYVLDPYQGLGQDISARAVYLPTPNIHFELSLTYSDFTRSSDRIKEYDYLIVRSRNTYQVNRYLFFRGIIEYNSFRKEILTDLLASFTYIPGTVIHLGYGSLYQKFRAPDGYERTPLEFHEVRRGLFFKASYLWRW